MTYPTSSDVSAGQPTSYLHYNSLRADAVYLGQLPADAVSLLASLTRYAHNLVVEPLATNRVRIPYNSADPCCLVIDGYMCKAAADVDLAADSFSGVAATWYIFANRAAGYTTFTLTANTSLTEAAGQRRIARIDWDGSNLVYPSLTCLFDQGRPFTYYARVRRAAVQAIANNGAAVSWDTKDADTDGMYSAGSPTRLTIVHPGLYIVNFSLSWAFNNAGWRGAQIRLNADATPIAAQQIMTMTSSGTFVLNVTTIRFLQAADYLTGFAYQDSGGNLNTADPTHMAAVALSE